LIPSVLGFFLFILLEPLVGWGIKKGISRTVGSIALVTASLVILGVITWSFYGAFIDVAGDVPKYASKIKVISTQLTQKAQKFESSTIKVVPSARVPDDVQKVKVVQGTGDMTGFLMRGLGSVFDALAEALFIPLLALFFLMDKPHMTDALDGVAPKNFKTHEAARETVVMIRGFFVGNLIIGLVSAAILTGLFMILHLKNAIALGLFAGFLNLIPFAGMVLALILPLAQALLQFNTAAPFIIISATTVVIHLAVGNIVVPKVVGEHINVNVLAATAGLLFWGWAWGAVGILVAVPMTAAIKILLENYEPTTALSRFLSDRPKPVRSTGFRQFLTRRFEPAKPSATLT
jgi:predicted PurR-regulated permease PerM